MLIWADNSKIKVLVLVSQAYKTYFIAHADSSSLKNNYKAFIEGCLDRAVKFTLIKKYDLISRNCIISISYLRVMVPRAQLTELPSKFRAGGCEMDCRCRAKGDG